MPTPLPATADELFAHLAKLGIELYLEGPALRFRAPAGVFTAELKAAVQAAKPALIERLRRPASALATPSANTSATPSIIPVIDRQQTLRMSFSQERIWFLYRLEGPSSTYNITPVFRLRGRLDQTAMAGALAALVNRHETLRMRFAESDGIGMQIVDPPSPVAVDTVFLGHLPANEQLAAAEQIILERTAQPFDLENGPLLKVSLLILADDDHILLPFMHHIISDGWSLGIFHREFGQLYEALVAGQAPALMPLPALPIQYPDYADWLRQRQQGAAGQAGLDFWRRALLGAPQTLSLPTDFPRPATQGFHGRVLHQQVPPATSEALQALARQQGCSLFMVLLAAYGVLLQRHCAQDDILVGSPVANRPLRETEGLIGCFVNTLILRLQLTGKPSFIDLLQRVRQMALDAYAHQEVPVEAVIDKVIKQRDPSRNPLYQAQFSLQNVPGGIRQLSTLTVEAMRMDRVAAKNDLSFILELGQDGIALELEYNTDLFDASTITRLGSDYQALLAALVQAPTSAIAALPLPSLKDAEIAKAPFIDWGRRSGFIPTELHNPPRRDESRPTSTGTFVTSVSLSALIEPERLTLAPSLPDYPDLVAAFAASVAAHPDACAVRDAQQQIDYRTLDRDSDAIANHLLRLGLAPETPVGLLFGRSISLISAMLGVLKAGAAYLPLAPEHPGERLAYCLRQAAAGAVLCDPQHVARATEVAPAGVAVCPVDDALLATPATGIARPAPNGQRLAYIIFTSGSTGQPKGVMIEHHSVLNLVAALQGQVYGDALQHSENSLNTAKNAPLKVALIASPVFDASVQQIFPALLLGHQLCLIDEKLRQDGAALCQRLADWQIDISDCTPSLLSLMLRGGLASTPSLQLRHLLVGGEALPRDLLVELYAGASGRKITVSNVYGPTECCVDVSCLRLSPGHLPASTILPIGYPLAGCTLQIVDAENNLLAAGEIGELLISGICVGRGYVNDPQRTAERFVALPQPGDRPNPARTYRSGDRCRQRPDGSIEFIGRNDEQVKIRGYRIEPGEIESRLREHPAIVAASVQARPAAVGHDAMTNELVAYLVCRDEVNRHDLHAFLSQSLPDYMVPAHFVPLPTLPLNASGKVDRNALPDPASAPALVSGIAHQAAASAAEMALVTVWQQTLRLPQVGVHDNYFASGGDSIKALQLTSRLRDAGWIMEIRDLFQYPSIARLAPHLKALPGSAPVATPPFVGKAPLSAVQHFFFTTYGPARQFNQALLLDCRRPITVTALQAALSILHREHDVLRCHFRQDQAGWRHEFLADITPALQHIDLRASADAAHALLSHCNAAQQAFALEHSPLFSSILFEMPDHSQRLLFSAHHLIVDGVSWRILLDDLDHLLADASQRPAASTRYPAWVASQIGWARTHGASEQAYWSSPHLAGPFHLPTDFVVSGPDTYADRQEIRAFLPVGRTRALLTDAQRSYATEINDLLIAALVRAWCAWSGDSRCALTLEGHGRESLAESLTESLTESLAEGVDASSHIDLSRSVGWFTSIFPVALALTPGDPGAQIKAVKESLRALPHKGVGYAILRYLAGLPGLAELPPLAFNYLGRFDGDNSEHFRPAPETLPPTAAADLPLPWPLEITAAVVTDQLEIQLAYSARRFTPDHAQRLLDTLLAELEQVIDHTLGRDEPALTVSDISYAGFSQATLDAFLAEHRELGPVENIYPLTPLQEGMYFHAQSEQNDSAYFEQWCLHIAGELQPERFRAAWNALFQRHEILRSVFTTGDGQRPLQAILRQRAVELTTLDLSTYSRSEAESQLLAARHADSRRGFQLACEPLVRLLLVRLAEAEWEIVWSHHHIIFDGWSVAVIQREFIEIYSALRAGRPWQLPPPFPFSRFMQSLPEKPELDFWQHYLAGYEALAVLPSRAQPGPAEWRRHICDLPAASTARLEQLCRQAGCTTSVFLQAVWGILLGRYNNSDDVVFGYVFSGRPPELPGIESAVGLFINTLPIRVRLLPGESFRQLLARLHATAGELNARQQTPLTAIQRACRQGETLFNHVLALENYPVDDALRQIDPAATGFTTQAALSNDRTHYAFDLVVMPHAGSLRFRFSYASDVHDDELIHGIGEQLLTSIERLLEQPDLSPCRLNILPAATWQAVVEAGNATAAPYPDQHTLFELFAAQAAARPAAPAVLAPHGDNRWWTYGQLAEQAAALGGALQALGIAGTGRVAVFLPPDEYAIVAVLGILHAGAAYVPIDPEYPAERIAFILADASVAAVVTRPDYRDRLPALAVPCVDCSALPAISSATMPPALRVSPDATAYVIYTSGSTGTPKGCEISQRNVVRLLCNDHLDFRIGPDDTWVMAHSLSFDFSVWEIYGALLLGGRLLVPSRETVRNVPEFHGLLRDHQVSVLNQTPLAFYSLLAFEASLDSHQLDQHLRYVVFGGDRLLPARLQPWVALYPLDRVALINMYGITETTVHVTFCRLNMAQLNGEDSPIGRPLPETTVYIVDRHLNPQPPMAPGELVVGGSGVAKGYLNRPALTAERFIDNPFHPGRLYRSGDLAYRACDGQLFYLGRNDHQVKIRGHRIEPAEIETAIRALPTVDQVVVIAENGSAGLELSAYVVGPDDPKTLRDELAVHLPAHLLPTYVICCQQLPLTANGKLDRQALLQLRQRTGGERQSQHGEPQSLQSPQGAQEILLAGIWCSVLGIEQLSRHERYLSLGGDSIKSIQILARLRAHGLSLQLKDLFRYPTVAELAPRLTPLKRTVVEVDTQPFALTPIQLRFFAEHPVERNHFNHAVLFSCPPDTASEHLRQALQALLDQHAALRLRFQPQADGSWRQQVAAGQPVAFSTHPVSNSEALRQHADGEQRRLDIEHGPLLRTIHYQFPNGPGRLLLIAHHLSVDGVSWRIIHDDLNLALQQAQAGQPIVLPPVSDSFSRWSDLLHERYAPSLTQLPYWQQMDATVPDEACDSSGADGYGCYGAAAETGFTLSASATDELRRACLAYQTHVGELLLTAFLRAYGSWSGEDKLQLALESHGRDVLDDYDASRSIGWFTALYPLCLSLTRLSEERQIKEIKESLRRVPDNGLAYGILRYLGPDNNGLDARPAVCFNYLGEFATPAVDAVLSFCTEAVGAAVSPRGPRPFALDVSASIAAGRLQCSLGYATPPLAEARVRQLCRMMETELAAVVAHCLRKTSPELTPSDLTFKGLTLDELDSIFDED